MSASVGQYLRAPVGADAHRWSTLPGEKLLVIAARTVTSTVRVLEVLPALVRGDTRITVVFAYDPTSAFNDGVLDLLQDAGCRVMPWPQLAAIDPDLILTASENIDVPPGDCPVLVLPHGVGFQKLVPDSRSERTRLSGVVPDSLLETGRAWLAVSHPDQEQQLLATHPKAAGRTLLIGDPCFDELSVSLPRAPAYRRALDVADGHRLVVVSSTWGPTSLLGQDPQLPARLLAALPYDEYRVAAILHPNVWSAHGSWQIRTWQAAALEAGLLLMPTVHAWRSALVAASAVVGDHGSVTLLGAAIGKPVLLATFGTDVVPGTAVDRLGEVAPHLDRHQDLRQQVESAVQGHAPERYGTISELAFAEPGQALARLRGALYQLLDLAEPSSAPPPVLSLPLPAPPAAPVTSWVVMTAVATSESGQRVVTVSRRPAAVFADGTETAEVYTHLACDEEERDQRLTESASALLCRRPAPSLAAARHWVSDTLERLPGSRLATIALTKGGHLTGVRDGRTFETTVTGPPVDAGLPAALVYTCLRAGLPLADGLVTLGIGGSQERTVRLRLGARLPAAP